MSGWLSMLLAMGAVLLSWAVTAPALVGLGAGIWRLFRLADRESSADGWPIFLRFWLGFAGAIAVLQVWHLFFRVSGAATILILALGAVGWVAAGREIIAAAKGCIVHRGTWVALGISFLWAANRAMGPADSFDDGMYHLQVVKWFSTYPIVPGLANLHVRFGFNNPTFLWVAAMGTGPWAGRGTHLANPLLTAVALFQCILAAAALLADPAAPRQRRARRIFLIFMIPAVVFHAVNRDGAGAGTDLPLTIICLTAWGSLVAFLIAPDPDSRQNAAELWSIVALFALSACIKLSGAPLALLGAAIAIGVWLHRDRQNAKVKDMLLRVVIWAAALGGPWLARSCILSGYPLFPSTVLGLPVDWKASPTEAWNQREHIRVFPRQTLPAFIGNLADNLHWHFLPRWIAPPTNYEADVRGLRWLAPWALAQVAGFPTETVMPILIGLIALIVLRRRDETNGYAWIAVAGTLLSLIFWIATAPEPRFGMATCWAFGGTCLAMSSATSRGGIRFVCVCLALCAVPILHRMVGIKATWHRNPLRSVPIQFPGIDHGFHPAPITPTRPTAARNGLIVNVATDHKLLYNAPLPASPEPSPNVELRQAGNLSRGFRNAEP